MQGVERLALDEHRHVRGGEPIDANNRRIADRAQNAVVNHDDHRHAAGFEPPTPVRYVAITDAYDPR